MFSANHLDVCILKMNAFLTGKDCVLLLTSLRELIILELRGDWLRGTLDTMRLYNLYESDFL